MKGKNGTTSFLPERRKGGKFRFSEEVTYIPNVSILDHVDGPYIFSMLLAFSRIFRS